MGSLAMQRGARAAQSGGHELEGMQGVEMTKDRIAPKTPQRQRADGDWLCPLRESVKLSVWVFSLGGYEVERVFDSDAARAIAIYLVRAREEPFVKAVAKQHYVSLCTNLRYTAMARREGEILTKRLPQGCHPNITQCLAVVDLPTVYTLLLRHEEGGDLFTALTAAEVFPLQVVQRAHRHTLSALNFALGAGVIHCDVKLENVLISRSWSCVADLQDVDYILADWGLAIYKEAAANPSKRIHRGSQHYGAPEVAHGLSSNSAASDSWSCGVMLFAMATGRMPFSDAELEVDMPRRRNGEYSYTPNEIKMLPIRLRELIRRHLDPSPIERINFTHALDHPWMLTQLVPLVPDDPTPPEGQAERAD